MTSGCGFLSGYRLNWELGALAQGGWPWGRLEDPDKQKPVLGDSWGMLNLGFYLPSQSPSAQDIVTAVLGCPIWT